MPDPTAVLPGASPSETSPGPPLPAPEGTGSCYPVSLSHPDRGARRPQREELETPTACQEPLGPCAGGVWPLPLSPAEALEPGREAGLVWKPLPPYGEGMGDTCLPPLQLCDSQTGNLQLWAPVSEPCCGTAHWLVPTVALAHLPRAKLFSLIPQAHMPLGAQPPCHTLAGFLHRRPPPVSPESPSVSAL